MRYLTLALLVGCGSSHQAPPKPTGITLYNASRTPMVPRVNQLPGQILYPGQSYTVSVTGPAEVGGEAAGFNFSWQVITVTPPVTVVFQ